MKLVKDNSFIYFRYMRKYYNGVTYKRYMTLILPNSLSVSYFIRLTILRISWDSVLLALNTTEDAGVVEILADDKEDIVHTVTKQ